MPPNTLKPPDFAEKELRPATIMAIGPAAVFGTLADAYDASKPVGRELAAESAWARRMD